MKSLLIVVLALCCAACGNNSPTATLAATDTAKTNADTAIATPDTSASVDSASTPDTATCKVSADCPGKKDLCVGGTCQAQVACASDKQCAAAGMVCDPKAGVCVQCLTVDDCSGGALCKAHTCVAPAKSCVSTKECDAGMVCDKPNKQCVECAGPEDCTKGLGCVETVCVPLACEPGKTKCKGTATVQTCKADGGGWDETGCGADSSCVGGACAKKVCVPGEKVCVAGGVATCLESGIAMGDAVACGDGQVCDGGQCVAFVCKPGEVKCLNGELAACKPSGAGWDSVACGSDSVCSEGACVAKVCEAGLGFCAGDQPMQCDSTGAAASKLPACTPGHVCMAGQCVAGNCTAGQKVCADGVTVATCKGDGSGYDNVACGAGHVCVGAACKGVVCTANLAGCQGTQKVMCDATGTVATVVEDCAKAGKVCSGGACVVPAACVAGSKVCEAGKLKTCKSDGSGYDSVSCDDGNACTVDSCDAVKGCANAAVGDGTGCDVDGNKCTADGCKAGVCVKGAAVGCDDKNACTVDSCDAGTGACSFVKAGDGAFCDDGDACTVSDGCLAGVCKGVAKVCPVAGQVCVAGACAAPCVAGTVWATKNYPGVGSQNLHARPAPMADGGWALGGFTDAYHGLVVRTDAAGAKLWQKELAWNEGHIYAVTAMKGGGVAAAGESWENFQGAWEYCGRILILAADGTTLADVAQCADAKTGKVDQTYLTVGQRGDGALFAAGYGKTGQDYDTSDALVVLFDETGKLIWMKSLGGALDDRLLDSLALNDGSFITSGYTKIGTGHNGLLTRLGPGGQVIWSTTSAKISEILAMQTSTPDTLAVVGGNGWMAEYTIDGALNWQTQIGAPGTVWLRDLARLADGTFAALQSQGSNPYKDPNVLHLDASGAVLQSTVLPIGDTLTAARLAHGLGGKLAVSFESSWANKPSGKLMLLCDF